MRNWPANFIAQLQAEGYRPFFLVHFAFGTAVTLTDCDVPLVNNAITYNPRPLEISDVKFSMSNAVDNMTVDIDMADRDQAILDEFVGGTPGDTPAHLGLQVLDGDMQEIETITLFSGKIDLYDYQDNVLSVTIASFHSLWNKMAMQRSTPHCRRNFKKVGCGYAGAEMDCDRSYTRCQVLANTAQYNGFRFLPDILDATIWWGQIPKSE